MRELSAPPRSRRTGALPLWIIAVLLAFIAGRFAFQDASGPTLSALAQAGPLAGARGVYAFSGQIDRNRWGLFMLDIEQGTVWCYAMDTENATPKMRLIAGRSWIYDRYLRDFNGAPPTVADIQQLVAIQRDARPQTPPTSQPAESP